MKKAWTFTRGGSAQSLRGWEHAAAVFQPRHDLDFKCFVSGEVVRGRKAAAACSQPLRPCALGFGKRKSGSFSVLLTCPHCGGLAGTDVELL